MQQPDCLKEISAKIASGFKENDKLARNMLKVLICGSHKGDDKKHIESLRNEIRSELGIPGTFLMEDIIVEGVTALHEKFDLIWQQIMKGDSVPLCILFAGETSGDSVGLNAEIQNIARDPQKKVHTHIIRIDGAKVVPYANEFPCILVSDVSAFKKVAKEIVGSKVNEVRAFLSYKKDENDKKRVPL